MIAAKKKKKRPKKKKKKTVHPSDEAKGLLGWALSPNHHPGVAIAPNPRARKSFSPPGLFSENYTFSQSKGEFLNVLRKPEKWNN